MSRPGRPQRLPLEAYEGERSCAFTACMCDHHPFFLSPEVVEPQIEFLKRAGDEFGCIVVVYCFMPDHLHVMFQGTGGESNCLAAMRKFKLLSGLWMHRKKVLGWQEDFYDHLVWGSKDWRAHARYIALNPVRASLVESYLDYPFLGSLVGEVQEVIAPV